MAEFLTVGMGKLKVARSPAVLAVYGIGSCVAVAMYDYVLKIGGIAHVTLPEILEPNQDCGCPGKCAESGVKYLLELLEKKGSEKKNISVKIVGGSEMFSPSEDFEKTVGYDNICSVKSVLQKLNLKLTAEDIGGNKGRSIEFDLQSGIIKVSFLGEEIREI